jgi:hypothetical protein
MVLIVFDLIYQGFRLEENSSMDWPLSFTGIGWADVAAGTVANVIG